MEATICITSDNISEDYHAETIDTETKDPLEDLDIYADSPKYYRLNETVFAEPIEMQETAVEMDADNEICFIDNLMVQKTAGRRNKYYIDADRNCPSPTCPQPDCNKPFSTWTLLRAHIRRVHCADRNKYICECCGAGFSARYLLLRHAAVHGERRAQCALCGRALSTRTDMAVHLRRHANTRPHACHLCSRAFVRRAALAAHVRFVHRTGDLRCHRCGERFPSRKLLTKHKACQPK